MTINYWLILDIRGNPFLNLNAGHFWPNEPFWKFWKGRLHVENGWHSTRSPNGWKIENIESEWNIINVNGKMCRRITKLTIVKSWLWLFCVYGFQVFYLSKTERLSSKYSATSFPGSSFYLRCFSWRHVLCDDHRDLSKAWLNKRDWLLPGFKPWRTRCESVNYGISNYWST